MAFQKQFDLSVFRLNILRTCKKLNSLLKSFFIVNRKLELETGHNLSPMEFDHLTSGAANLRVLRVPDCFWMTDDTLKTVLKNNRRLEHLDLSNCRGCSSVMLQVRHCHCHVMIVMSC